MSKTCLYDMNKICNPDECDCDEDITDVTNYTHLKEAVEFSSTIKCNHVYGKCNFHIHCQHQCYYRFGSNV